MNQSSNGSELEHWRARAEMAETSLLQAQAIIMRQERDNELLRQEAEACDSALAQRKKLHQKTIAEHDETMKLLLVAYTVIGMWQAQRKGEPSNIPPTEENRKRWVQLGQDFVSIYLSDAQ